MEVEGFPEMQAQKLTDDTVVCTVGELIDLVGEERASGLLDALEANTGG